MSAVPVPRFVASLALCVLALALLPEALMFPNSGFFFGPFVIPFITGVFLRSVIAGLFFLAAWVYRYGFMWTLLLGYVYWGFGGMVFNALSATVWGGNAWSNFWLLLSYGQSFPSFLLRIVVFPTATLALFMFKLYKVNLVSVSLLAAWLALIISGAALLPHDYLLGERFVPDTILPQLYEFGSLVVSFVFALSFFRPYQGVRP